MATIKIYGITYTAEQATLFVEALKNKYEANKDKETFIFQGQEIVPTYAKYLIEYVEHHLNKQRK